MRLAALLVALAGVLCADNRCQSCHPEQVKSYAATGMARSITIPSAESAEHAEFNHALSKTIFRVTWQEGKLLHEMTRSGHRSAYTADWAIGSGNHGKSYLIKIGDALFQSPSSWYTARHAWDLSPGFDKDQHPEFFRPVTADCLFCHAEGAWPRPGTLNRYFDQRGGLTAITCDRCHGDSNAHLRARTKTSIVNPARLDSARRGAVCEQCHLSGEARIPNPYKKFSDYSPGMAMEEVFTVFVKNSPKTSGLKVVSHSEQMALSRCSIESAAGKDCAGCHMPKIKAYDGGHTAFTDHWIRLNRASATAKPTDELRAWREPPSALRRRNLGLAYISVGSASASKRQLLEGLKLLGPQPADGAVETARGLALLRLGKPQEAVNAFRRAVDEEPTDSTRRLNFAAALFAAGDRVGAKDHAQKAMMLEPLLEDAYALLAEIEPRRAKYWKERYQKFAPQRVLP